MRCIYCLETGRSARGRVHIFPEALRANQEVLPKGAVCDDCNNYLGRLDEVVASHPLISVAIQFLELPGKGNRPRDVLGNVDRTVHPGGITIPCEKPQEIVQPDGTRTMRASPLFAPTFDFSCFRRGLHHIAMNLVASMDGVERVLDGSYDNARRYVRRPRKGENWTIAQYIPKFGQFGTKLTGGMLDNPEDGTEEYVWCGLLGMNFFVNLRSTGDLEQFVKTVLPPEAVVFDPAYKPPTSQPQGRNRYRITIFRDQ